MSFLLTPVWTTHVSNYPTAPDDPTSMMPDALYMSDVMAHEISWVDAGELNPETSAPAVVDKIKLTMTPTNEGITVSEGLPAKITGMYVGPLFPNQTLKYVPKGKSDLTVTPTVVGSFELLPQKDTIELFEFKPDTSSVTVTVKAEAYELEVLIAESTFTGKVFNNYTAGRNSIRNFFGT